MLDLGVNQQQLLDVNKIIFNLWTKITLSFINFFSYDVCFKAFHYLNVFYKVVHIVKKNVLFESQYFKLLVVYLFFSSDCDDRFF